MTLDGRGQDLDLVLGADLTQDAGRHAGTDDDAPPSQTLSPSVIGSPYSQPARRGSGSMGCAAVSSWTRVAIWQAAPIVIGATSSITASTFDERPVAAADLAVLAVERRTHDDDLSDVSQRPAQRRVALVPGARRGPGELGQPLLDASELGFVVGIVGYVQLAAQHPLSHLAHPSLIPRGPGVAWESSRRVSTGSVG